MPPTIPSSLNFPAPRDGARPSAFLRWPKSVIGFLTNYLAGRGGSNGTSGSANDEQAVSNSHAASTSNHVSSLRSTSSRKVSRADSVEDGGASGIGIACVEVGLLFGSTAEEQAQEDQRQALINATEQVVGSVRTLILQLNASRSNSDMAAHPPRILLFGSQAETRAQYLAHACSFGLESGNNPSDCTWPLLSVPFASGSAVFTATSSSPELLVRDDEGIHWSEDMDELFQLNDHSFDLILCFNAQFNPNDISLEVSEKKSITHKWMEKMRSTLRPGGVFAGIACLEQKAAGPTSATSAFTPVSTTSINSIPPSSPSSTHPLILLRSFRDRLEHLGFYMHTSVDLRMEGALVMGAYDEETTAPSAAENPFALNPFIQLPQLMCVRFLAAKVGDDASAAVNNQNPGFNSHPSSLVVNTARASPSLSASNNMAQSSPIAQLTQSNASFAWRSVTGSQPPIGAQQISFASLQRSSSSGSLNVGGPNNTISANRSSPAFRPTNQNLLSNLNARPILSVAVHEKEHGGFEKGSSSPPIPFHSSRAGHLASASFGNARSSPSPSPLDLPAAPLSASSQCSSASPSPKLSPSESSEHLSLLSLSQLPAHRHQRSQSRSAIDSASSSNRSSPSLQPQTPSSYQINAMEPIVISGVSLGLPNGLDPEVPHSCSSPTPAAGTTPPLPANMFNKLNFDRIFRGENFVHRLTQEDKSLIAGMNACQISKDKVTGKRTKHYLKDDPQLIQVASKMHEFSAEDKVQSLGASYGLPSHVLEVLDATYELAVCAGLEALKDAGFEGLQLSNPNPDLIGLPEKMRDETGVIFASSFPCLDSIIKEVTKKVAYETRKELMQQLQAGRPGEDDDAKSNGDNDKEPEYEYDRKLLFKLLVLANCQLAELIKARGPNVHINTACSGTTQAIATAEDWMKVGRCKRVIVISADVATNSTCMKYLATGFLALGAASIISKPQDAAAPFDKRRKGMILGTGSVGLVMEYASCALHRGATPKVELLGSHQGNSAFHATLMDAVSISQQLNVFLRRVEQEKGICITGTNSSEFTKDLIYFAHETNTSANGGCAKVEMDALASVWSDERGLTDARHQILITNTKGLTGHPMGVGMEDVVAVEGLHRGLVPPVANFRELDPKLTSLIQPQQISTGGSHNRNFVLRMAGGFGNQFAYVLYRKWNEQLHQTWWSRLQVGIAAQNNVLTKVRGYYSYPLQIASNPNSTLVSRVNSENDLQRLASLAQ